MAGQNEAPERVLATEEDAGRTCPYCRYPLKQGGQLAICGHCRCAHHSDCWDDNRGCAVLACAGGPAKESAAAPAGMAATGAAVGAGGFAPPPIHRVSEMWPSDRVPHGPPPPPPPPPPPSRHGFGTNSLVIALFVLALAVGGFAAALLLSKNKPRLAAAQVADTTHKTAQTTTPPVTTATQTVTVQSKTTTPPPTPTTPATAGTNNSTPANTAGATPPTTSDNTSNPDAGAATAINQYWQDVGNGDYTDAVNMETSSEQSQSSTGTFQSEQPHVNVMSVGTAVPNGSGQATVQVDFYAHNTVGNDQTCRHFTIDSLMVQSNGGWFYDGPAPNSNTTDNTADGDPNCPA